MIIILIILNIIIVINILYVNARQLLLGVENTILGEGARTGGGWVGFGWDPPPQIRS